MRAPSVPIVYIRTHNCLSMGDGSDGWQPITGAPRVLKRGGTSWAEPVGRVASGPQLRDHNRSRRRWHGWVGRRLGGLSPCPSDGSEKPVRSGRLGDDGGRVGARALREISGAMCQCFRVRGLPFKVLSHIQTSMLV
jgi:hypothetical protein